MKRNEVTLAMLARLLRFHAQDAEERVGAALLRLVEDPLKPRTEDGRFRANVILLALAGLGLLAMGTFLFFSLGGA